MSEAIDLIIREAQAIDAENILAVMKQVSQETEFLVMDEGLNLTPASLAHHIEAIDDSENNLLLLAYNGAQLIGTASVRASDEKRIAHIGEVGISILKDYWGFGLGSVLLEEVIAWAHDSAGIRRLELTVQAQNKRAIHLYEKFDFQVEATMARGAVGNDGRFLDVLLMSVMID
ncbi:GNAT family N-acetyltransferase [Enterococcus saccharolyticus]|uniref:N-acetyltransferase domain-containing protein n=1 Tax=Enterococcus saccharolyticus subsp. saccharolyticus ATCC 43076 TaxID=1139996 RepID=S0JCA4_9ENTE|nr:GNAT family protein [Enterococcus saccharolyticus]EOT29962.1 hypothetical protein OMQ_00654 [Enterococcus saccharolyticus subsp. saccharolyticus ATCC 43076]EOT80508.1 hypothetical protein I572_01035 [Enterococcus saccharolyticus subsp. saccharolyticus ATCC 43076]